MGGHKKILRDNSWIFVIRKVVIMLRARGNYTADNFLNLVRSMREEGRLIIFVLSLSCNC